MNKLLLTSQEVVVKMNNFVELKRKMRAENPKQELTFLILLELVD